MRLFERKFKMSRKMKPKQLNVNIDWIMKQINFIDVDNSEFETTPIELDDLDKTKRYLILRAPNDKSTIWYHPDLLELWYNDITEPGAWWAEDGCESYNKQEDFCCEDNCVALLTKIKKLVNFEGQKIT
jgi:hypothetical protein